jgi:hypothetical protein
MSTAVTPWFGGEVKPEYVGVYERQIYNSVKYALWNGRYWCSYTATADDAMRHSHVSSDYQYAKWRGLASNPKASKP